MRLVISFAVIALVIAFSEAARPRFSSLKNVYPTYSRYPGDGQKLKRDMGLPSWLFANGTPNTCAIRMSKAFHDAGLGINRSRVTRCGTSSARVSGKGRQYIIRVNFFKCYLAAIWGGRPNVSGIRSKSTIRDQKGLLIFTGCSGFGQHIDLWDGSSCSMGCEYFNRCSTIEMYTLQ
ncbi:uncharacterized protein [Littorina saxatilis]|uniref:Uncharacterized protein n=1 Tax=Littorina saxatilis TaxID=31220 RepID=A0AAN9BHY2_9CAEN